MQRVTRYSLIDPSRENRRAVIARDGQALPIAVDGLVVEAQFELGDGSALIWLTDDSPYDEGLHVYLIGPDDEVVDALEAGVDFAPGILNIRETGENWVAFSFFNNQTVYRLEIHKGATVRLRLPAGWRYKKLLSTYRLTVCEQEKRTDSRRLDCARDEKAQIRRTAI
jgi:hypothetical protein